MSANMPPLHLAVIVNNPTRDGGMQKFSRFLVETALDAGWQVTVACSGEDIYRDLAGEHPGMRVDPVNWLDANNAGDREYRWATVMDRRAWFRCVQPDVALFVQSSNTPYRAAILGARLAGVRVISTHRTMAWERDFTASGRHLFGLLPGLGLHRKRLIAKTWLTAAMADAVVCNSHRVAQRYQQLYRYPACKMHVIPNAVRLPTTVQPASACGAVRIGYVGRISSEKRLDILLRALARLRARASEDRANSSASVWRLQLHGTGPDEQNLRQLADQLGIADQVEWLGRPDDIAAAYQQLDILALCSPRESSSNMILEAMAAGKAVVVSDAGGLPELVDFGECGRIVPATDVDALAAALQELIADAPQRIALGAKARSRAERVHDEAAIRGQWLSLISNATTKTRSHEGPRRNANIRLLLRESS